MPVHDWTLVGAGVFHAFHTAWIGYIQSALNEGLLPKGYYALAEQHMGHFITDILTLHTDPEPARELTPVLSDTGGTAVAEAPPRTRHKLTLPAEAVELRRSLAIRHVSNHKLIALIEIVSPANKDRAEHVEAFIDKAAAALGAGIHLLLIDLFPPGPHDPDGLHGELLRKLRRDQELLYELPASEPLTLASYVAQRPAEVYFEHRAVGDPLPAMPLFLKCDRYINVPLAATYDSAYRGMPGFWRDVLEGRAPAGY
ncbi:MAG: DUF4058 family protein [Planctomycetia bacterium]|nr:DUF4058 family protein [Planctomycetia bacterium]